jgi:hypothetical protein
VARLNPRLVSTGIRKTVAPREKKLLFTAPKKLTRASIRHP